MRSIVILSLVISSLVCGLAHAEPVETVRLIPPASGSGDLGRDYDSAMKLQVTGAMFMGAGIVHLFGTTVAGFFAAEDVRCGRSRDCETWSLGVASASVTFALGAIFTIVGIPTYIEGTTRLRKLGLRGARFDPSGIRLTF